MLFKFVRAVKEPVLPNLTTGAVQIAAGGWHSAAISEFNDLYMFGWNESGQLALPTNLARQESVFITY